MVSPPGVTSTAAVPAAANALKAHSLERPEPAYEPSAAWRDLRYATPLVFEVAIWAGVEVAAAGSAVRTKAPRAAGTTSAMRQEVRDVREVRERGMCLLLE